MATIDQNPGINRIKCLVIGDSSVGKTYMLRSLALAGKKLAIMDFDNGLAPLMSLAKDENIRKNIHFVTLRDVGEPDKSENMAYARARDLIRKEFKDETENLGNVKDFGPEWVVVLDTLTFASQCAMNYTLKVNNKKVHGTRPSQPDIGEAQNWIEMLLRELTYDGFKYNLIVNAHASYKGDKIFPETIGKALNPRIPPYFNTVVRLDRVTLKEGDKDKTRVLITRSKGDINLRTPVGDKLPEYIEPDLNLLFNTILEENS